jgi:hypothetical protein
LKSDSRVEAPSVSSTKLAVAGTPAPLLQPTQGKSSRAFVRSATIRCAPPSATETSRLTGPESIVLSSGAIVSRPASSRTSVMSRTRPGARLSSGSVMLIVAASPLRRALASMTALYGSTTIEPCASLTRWPSSGSARARS